MFESVEQLAPIASDMTKLVPLLKSTSCLAIILETGDTEDISLLVDFLADIRVDEKHMLVKMNAALNADILSNKTINFNVMISETDIQSEGKISFGKTYSYLTIPLYKQPQIDYTIHSLLYLSYIQRVH